MIIKGYSAALLSTFLFLSTLTIPQAKAADRLVVIPLHTGNSKAKGTATAGDVLTGKTFSSEAGYDIAGSLVDNGAITITPTTTDQAILAGYHNGSGAVSGDSNLNSANIRSGVSIFGIAGDVNVVNTSSGDAGAGDILSGKAAWVDGYQVRGTMTNNGTGSTITPTTTDQSVTAGYWASANTVAGDTALVSGNIKAGASIFGVAGDANVVNTSSGDAGTVDILDGKIAWIDGTQVTGAMPNNGSGGTITPSTTDQTVAAGYWASANTVAGDTNLAAGNIKAGVTIFSVTGTYPLAAVARTGQTVSYATNDDGDLQKGISFPNPRFTDNGDGTVTDNMTSLVWLKNANCDGLKTWAAALTWVNTLANGTCGLTDGSTAGTWRMANLREEQSLIDYNYANPALSSNPFSGVQVGNSYYWSSTSYSIDPSSFVWAVIFTNGAAQARKNDIATTSYVWPVRD